MHSYKTHAIVLSKRTWRENDLLFSFYTENFGKVEVLATGAEKIKSKLVGHLSTFGIVEIEYVRGRLFNRLTHTYLIENFGSKTDENYIFTSLIREVVNKATQEDYPQHEIWKSLNWAITEIQNADNFEKKKLIINIFCLLILQVLGFQLKFNQNLVCPLINLPLDLPSFDLVQNIQNKNKSIDLSLPKKSNDQLFNFLHLYLQHNIERKFNSFNFIKQKNKLV
jgi:DNA repair protein RecO